MLVSQGGCNSPDSHNFGLKSEPDRAEFDVAQRSITQFVQADSNTWNLGQSG